MNRAVQHFHHHRWFYVALLLAGIAWFLTGMIIPRLRLFVAGDVFYLTYLILMGVLVAGATPDELRRRAAVDDEGMVFIGSITIVAIGFSLVSIFELLHQADKPDHCVSSCRSQARHSPGRCFM